MGYQVTPVKGLASLSNTKKDHFRRHLVKGIMFIRSSNAELCLGPETRPGCRSNSISLSGPRHPAAK